jgi:superfamily II RNA helicase
VVLVDHLPADPDPDALLDAFVDWVGAQDMALYEAQEDAVLELLAGRNVILNTPTGSGKSLVAAAAHFAGLARGVRSVYTAPIKALVSEKFFALCREFGSDRVGMITGDAAVNREAPIICCTAEILSNWALHRGAGTDAGLVVMDEFHYYGDPQRGVAWQIPLLELPRTQFLLMSATLGSTGSLEEDLTRRTGRGTVTVRSHERPVPLEFGYRETPLHESIQELLETGRAPVYIVHFTQAAASEQAQNLMSMDVLTRAEKEQVREQIGTFRFDTPVGKDLKRFVSHGIGLHHAGMLPKYRRLVERLAQVGLLKLICGTDTLGVGVNVPIRSVLLTQLCKFDGGGTRVLSVREFQQIAGRAGRKGFDDQGTVWVQAPAHWIENRRAEAKAVDDPKKRKKLVKRKPPEKGYVHWSEDTFTRLVNGNPELLDSSFRVDHMMVLTVLDRPGDGCRDLRVLLTQNHEPRARQRKHIRRAVHIYRSLAGAGIVERLPEPDGEGRLVRVNLDLQEDFALHQPLSPFVLEAIPLLDREAADYPLEVLSVVESVLENPAPIIRAQQERARSDAVARMKAEGLDYDQRMAQLGDVSHPKPLADVLYPAFDRFRQDHPWVEGENIRPKSVARELYERGTSFRDYVATYGLKRSEGVVLRYLSDAYKGLVQNVPEDAKTDEVYDLTEWLGELVRQVDSSLIDEWERLQNPDAVEPGGVAAPDERRDVTANLRAFRVMVRNEVFRWVQLVAARDLAALAEVPPVHEEEPWTAQALAEAVAPYWEEHGSVRLDPEARGPVHFSLREDGLRWSVRQTLLDPEGWGEWALTGVVDLAASREAGEAVVRLGGIVRA